MELDATRAAAEEFLQADGALRALHAQAAVDYTVDQQSQVELWMEPGRYFVASAGVLIARLSDVHDARSIATFMVSRVIAAVSMA